MDEGSFAGEIKRIQWNNHLKTAALSAYFFFGLMIFTAMLVAVVLIPAMILDGPQAVLGYITQDSYSLFKVIRPFLKIMSFLTLGIFIFIAVDLKRVDKMFRAKKLDMGPGDWFYRTLENMCIARGLRMPALYVTDTQNPVIPPHFITGVVTESFTKQTSLIVTPAVLEDLSRPQCEAFLAQVVQRIYNRDTMFLTLFCFIGFFPHHLQKRGNRIFRVLARPFLYSTERCLRPIRAQIIQMRFGRLDVGALELTKEKKPMAELLERLTPMSEISNYIHDPYLTLFIARTGGEYRHALLQRA